MPAQLAVVCDNVEQIALPTTQEGLMELKALTDDALKQLATEKTKREDEAIVSLYTDLGFKSVTHLALMTHIRKYGPDESRPFARAAYEITIELAKLCGCSPLKLLDVHAPTGRKPRCNKGVKLPPKYKGPNNETWAGKGRKPLWFTAAVEKGVTEDSMLVTNVTH